jgi:uncharacterized membrane protein
MEGQQSNEVRPFAVPTRQLLATLALVVAALVVWAAHAVYFGGHGWRWYLWNLWLAVVPLGLSTWLSLARASSSTTRVMRWPVLAPALVCWLLFFPNAAYLVTDIVHLPRVTWSARFTVEAAMILLFATAGAAIALVSLVQVRDVVLHRLPWSGRKLLVAEAGFVGGVAVLNGFGIALGRLARSNSWDVWTAPQQLLDDVVTTANSAQGLTMTLVATVLLVCAYLFAAPSR